MCSLITLLNILMNQKARLIGKRKVSSSARKRLRKLHTSEYANSCFTKKKKIILYFKEDTIDSEKLQSTVSSLASWERTIQAAPSQREERKKKSQEREREREEERVRTRKKREKKKRRRRKRRRKRRKGKKRRRRKRKKWR